MFICLCVFDPEGNLWIHFLCIYPVFFPQTFSIFLHGVSSGSTWTVRSGVLRRKCLITTSACVWRAGSGSRRSPACFTLCCESWKTRYRTPTKDLKPFKHLRVSLSSVPPVTAGPASGCRGCTLCGSAGSSSPSTGSQSCYVRCITRSGLGLRPAVIYLSKYVWAGPNHGWVLIRVW